MPKKQSNSAPDFIIQQIEKIGGKVFDKLDDLKPSYIIPTKLFSLDRIISDECGVPGNCCVDVYGENSTGKTSLALQTAASAQKQGMKVFYVNAERSINSSIVSCFPALDASKVLWVEPDNGEAAIDIMKMILKSETKCLVVNDSIPACLPSKISDASAGDSHVGDLARLFSPFMPIAKKFCRLNDNVLMQLNQTRSKIGPMSRGNEQPGGKAIKFYSDIRIELGRKYPNPQIESGGDVIGHYISAKVVKTRWCVPFQQAVLPLIYGKGFDIGRELAECAIALGIVVRRAAWYNLYEEDADIKRDEPVQKFQGLNKLAAHIRQNKDMQKLIKNRVKEIMS